MTILSCYTTVEYGEFVNIDCVGKKEYIVFVKSLNNYDL